MQVTSRRPFTLFLASAHPIVALSAIVAGPTSVPAPLMDLEANSIPTPLPVAIAAHSDQAVVTAAEITFDAFGGGRLAEKGCDL